MMLTQQKCKTSENGQNAMFWGKAVINSENVEKLCATE
ncbi:hypothetical protein JCM19233_493 [Vibrio astriarenae]|nr:hypothetical protein JCM19233_493 [Vibrio sp. C7]